MLRNSPLVVGLRPSGSKPRSPAKRSVRIVYHWGPEGLQRCLLESKGSWRIDVAAKERVVLLAHKYAQGCKHGNAAVLQLDLTVEEKLTLGCTGGEAEWVEKVQASDAGHVLRFELY